ncbi:HAMP domain-containing histidine kinase [Psychrosphaera ytuae]|uniref:histidine kinase n=1 Tax=Psychrosphaera ytuae TaxID=2820710 RepID=A0A975DCC8_9GAMM|nr:HAMP domain-containing sensor histidine kinase [Psychrosphaera ytuae]QTH64149.1 HAMP domain-containing histidine kinase [Psychrosphaera ytuae]
MENRYRVNSILAGNLTLVVIIAATIGFFVVNEGQGSEGFEISLTTKALSLMVILTFQMLFLIISISWIKLNSDEELKRILSDIESKDDIAERPRIQIDENYSKENKELISAFNRNLDNYCYTFQQTNMALQAVRKELNFIKEKQEDIIETEKMASLGRLVAGVAHEINTPLGIAVTGMTHLKTQKVKTDGLLESGKITANDLKSFLKEAEKSIDLVLNQVYIAADLIKNFKQVAVDQSAPVTREIELSEYIEKVLSTLRPIFKKTPFKLVPEELEVQHVLTCPGALSQVITILIQNALHHAFEGRSVGFVYVLYKVEDNKVLITIRDDGVGVPISQRKKIFEPFFTTKRGHGGSGLGLSLAYNICKEVLKGKLYFLSNDLGGSDFVIEIPVERD